METTLFLKKFCCFSFLSGKSSGKKYFGFSSSTCILLFLCIWNAEHWVLIRKAYSSNGNDGEQTDFELHFSTSWRKIIVHFVLGIRIDAMPFIHVSVVLNLLFDSRILTVLKGKEYPSSLVLETKYSDIGIPAISCSSHRAVRLAMVKMKQVKHTAKVSFSCV